ncbi:tumor necrosis factor receptor superfamily member 16-like [Lethenteron reissneri]|uniref:tumor necrosis factor receptor superfamily member 16-like n=1 Tax=Lethenteron reissneri TaxID=7753 RepID=UPI002AB67976|nr:tumor necrosis factor receptor superfamily member 16-like [Lethenteron reissneri]
MWPRVGLLVASLACGAFSSCPSKTFTDDGTCCLECPPGMGVAEPCQGHNNTQCQPCLDSVTFSATESHVEECVPCSLCPARMRVHAPCTSTEDTVCECSSGLFANPQDGACIECHVCPPGFGVVVQCSPDEDSSCAPCMSGFYSEESSDVEPCMPCSSCSEDQEVQQECTSSADTNCVDKDPEQGDSLPSNQDIFPSDHDYIPQDPFPQDPFPEDPISENPFPDENPPDKTNDDEEDDDDEEEEKEEEEGSEESGHAVNGTNGTPSNSQEPLGDHSRDIIPVYCSIMAAVVVGLVAYVVFKRWHSCKNVQGSKARGEYSQAADGEKQHQDSGVFVDVQNAQEQQQPQSAAGNAAAGTKWLYDALPPHKQEEVERLLLGASGTGADDATDWKGLAAALGYAEAEIAELSEGERPAHALLAGWSSREGASEDLLLDALGRLQRSDVVATLRAETSAVSVV